jgi:hypothetical protein
VVRDQALTPTSPFLISARCLIAARHLPADRRLVVLPSLHLLCREHTMSFILSSTPNLAFIQALHILSTWETIESLTSTGERMEVRRWGAHHRCDRSRVGPKAGRRGGVCTFPFKHVR